MFQEIIHDGLVGVEFAGSFVITYDVPNARVIVEPRIDRNETRDVRSLVRVDTDP